MHLSFIYFLACSLFHCLINDLSPSARIPWFSLFFVVVTLNKCQAPLRLKHNVWIWEEKVRTGKARCLRYLLRIRVSPSNGRRVRKGGFLFGHFHLQKTWETKNIKLAESQGYRVRNAVVIFISFHVPAATCYMELYVFYVKNWYRDIWESYMFKCWFIW